MAIQLTVVDTGRRGNRRFIRYRANFSGNYVAGGDTVDFTQALNPGFLPNAYPTVSYIPQASDIDFQDAAVGFDAEWTNGTTNSNGKMQLFSSGGVEINAGAYAASIVADEVFMEVQIPVGK